MKGIRPLFRTLTWSPAFSIAAILTLALGIGGTTAMFSVVDGVLLEPLPFRNPDRLFMVWTRNMREGIDSYPLSHPDFLDFRSEAKSFQAMSAIISFQWNAVLSGGEEPRRVVIQFVSGSLFPTLGIQALRGRVLLPDDDRPESPYVVLLSHRLWSRRFGADPGLVGRTVTLDGQSAVVAGILPPGVRLFDEADLWAPLAHNPNTRRNRRSHHWLRVVARLGPAARPDQAQAEMEEIAHRLEQTYPATNKNLGARIVPLKEEMTGKARPALIVLLGAAGCILLIACANVANLMTSRNSVRAVELVIRRSLGATRLHLARQILAEGLCLALVGGTLAMLLAVWALQLLKAAAPADLPRLHEIAVDWRVLGFTVLATMFSMLLFCFPAILEAWRADLAGSLRQGTRHAQASASHRLQHGIVASEIALALTLLIAAGLLVRSFDRLLQVDLGFETDKLLTLNVQLPSQKYDSDPKRLALCRQLLERLENLPEVSMVALARDIPFRGRPTTTLEIQGQSRRPEERPEVDFHGVSPDYFRVMGIPFLQGSTFSEGPSGAQARQVIVNRSAAKMLWNGEDPLGKGLRYSGMRAEAPWWRVAGVAEDIRHAGPDSPPYPEIYFSLPDDPPGSPWIVAQTAIDPAIAASAIRKAVRSLDRDLVIDDVAPMGQRVSELLGPRRFNTVLMGGFSALALALAIVGIYGVISCSVAQRQREIGIRMALGATAREILGIFLLRGLRLTGLGLALGLAAALAATRFLESLLFGVASTDPWTFFSAPLALLAASLAAHVLPARRAARTDAVLALRR